MNIEKSKSIGDAVHGITFLFAIACIFVIGGVAKLEQLLEVIGNSRHHHALVSFRDTTCVDALHAVSTV